MRSGAAIKSDNLITQTENQSGTRKETEVESIHKTFGIKRKSIKEIKSSPTSKEDLFKGMEVTFDYALPQTWLDTFSKWCTDHLPVCYGAINYNLIRSTSVMAYPKDDYARVVSACTEVHEAQKLYMKLRGWTLVEA